jgi:hypothetical protein
MAEVPEAVVVEEMSRRSSRRRSRRLPSTNPLPITLHKKKEAAGPPVLLVAAH